MKGKQLVNKTEDKESIFLEHSGQPRTCRVSVYPSVSRGEEKPDASRPALGPASCPQPGRVRMGDNQGQGGKITRSLFF